MIARAFLFLVMLAFGLAFSGIATTAESGRAPGLGASNVLASGFSDDPLRRSESRLPQTLPSPAIIPFDIPAEPLSSALIDFGRQAQVSLVLPSRPFDGLVSTPVYGELSTDEALAQLLRCLPFRARTQGDTLIVSYRDGAALSDSPPAKPMACTTQGALVS